MCLRDGVLFNRFFGDSDQQLLCLQHANVGLVYTVFMMFGLSSLSFSMLVSVFVIVFLV